MTAIVIPGANQLAPPGSPLGNYLRDEFIAAVLDICGKVETLWLPKLGNTTTTTESSQKARVYTYDATIASRIGVQGSGLSVSFDGISNEADTPDVASLSFGDSSNDSPFSIVAWLNQTATTGVKQIFAKYDTAGTLREYAFYLDAAEKLNLELYDESTDGTLIRRYNTALATGSVLNVAATYDGLGVQGGIKLYSAAAQIDDTNGSGGAYTAMENLATVGRIFSSGSGTPAEYFSGTGHCIIVVRGALSVDELWMLKAAGNAYFGLAL